ncbi:hypothetical protein BN946_scf184858.g36 [Trametes cinnabarina]|uniref:Uncharacterized protein n=1 Tax=Pycnoporus cinnabarinus TaxID=5643 RepID=A0A060SN23_PYCCI|nr:hypothetical protein BN946_scf184858.g36 [Trametes cinnabarina]
MPPLVEDDEDGPVDDEPLLDELPIDDIVDQLFGDPEDNVSGVESVEERLRARREEHIAPLELAGHSGSVPPDPPGPPGAITSGSPMRVDGFNELLRDLIGFFGRVWYYHKRGYKTCDSPQTYKPFELYVNGISRVLSNANAVPGL